MARILVTHAQTGERVAVAHIVLVNAGDLARSPRASLHAHSLVRVGYSVTVIGYGDACALQPMWPEFARYRLIDEAPANAPARRKLAHLQAALTQTLEAIIEPVDAVLLMAPPSVPTADVLKVWADKKSARLIIDWHNLGSLRMAAKYGAWHPATLVYRKREQRAIHLPGVRHLAVTRALADKLNNGAAVLWDCPTQQPPEKRGDKRTFLEEHANELPPLDPTAKWIVAPSSWTDEERLDLLMEALINRETKSPLPTQKIAVIFTGRGPLLAEYQAQLRAAIPHAENIHFIWLSWPAYQALLRCADVGICCHAPDHGLDLPFKLAEFVGAGLRAWYYDYDDAIAERPNFHNHDEPWDDVATLVLMLMYAGTPAASGEFFLNVGPWDEHWQAVALPLISGQ